MVIPINLFLLLYPRKRCCENQISIIIIVSTWSSISISIILLLLLLSLVLLSFITPSQSSRNISWKFSSSELGFDFLEMHVPYLTVNVNSQLTLSTLGLKVWNNN